MIFLKNGIHNSTIKQYLEIAAISSHCLSCSVMLQITVEYFNFQTTVVQYKSIQLKSFASLFMENVAK